MHRPVNGAISQGWKWWCWCDRDEVSKSRAGLSTVMKDTLYIAFLTLEFSKIKTLLMALLKSYIWDGKMGYTSLWTYCCRFQTGIWAWQRRVEKHATMQTNTVKQTWYNFCVMFLFVLYYFITILCCFRQYLWCTHFIVFWL